MSSNPSKYAVARAGRVLAIVGLAVWCTRCDLPRGDDNLPPTDVAGIEREGSLRLLAPPDVRRIGAVIPITVEASFSANAGDDTRYCVRLAGAPGKLVFPFGDRCGGTPTPSTEGGGGEAGAASGGATGGQEASDVAGGGNGGTSGVPAGGGGNSGGAAAGTAGTENASHLLNVTQSCIAPTVRWDGGVYGTLHAAYFAIGEERTASLFGVLYDNANCSGEPIASSARLLDLRDASRDGMAEGGTDSGDTDSVGGAAPAAGGSGAGGIGGTGGTGTGGGSSGDGGTGGTVAAGGEPSEGGQGGGP